MKKNKKNMNLNWIFFRLCGILLSTCAGLCPYHVLSGEDVRAENERLKAENRRLAAELAFRENENTALRKELIETLEKYSTQAGRMRRMEASSAGTIETLEPVYTGAREMELAADLQTCISTMKKSSAVVLNFADEFTRRLSGLNLDRVETAKLRIQMDSLRSAAMDLAGIAAPPPRSGHPGVHRVLELDPRSRLVILKGGYRDGLREGIVLGYDDVALKIVAVRNFVSAACVVSGKFEKLAVGTEVGTSFRK